MSQNNSPLRYEYVVYPLWRRRIPAWIRPFSESILRQHYPVDADYNPPANPLQMAQFLSDWGIVGDFVDVKTIERGLQDSQAQITRPTDAKPPEVANGPVRIPAQWEPMEKILMSWGILYTPLWEMHAQMAEAISHVAELEILVPTAMWAHAIWFYLAWRDKANLENIHFLTLPTNDIWIRDYGPIMGLDKKGKQVAINPVYDVLPQYPQHLDNAMPDRWAGHHQIQIKPISLYTEGGNLWSDGKGTLLMSEQVFYSNRFYTREGLLAQLHRIFDFEKLIITPRLTLEETGHIDLLVKMASQDTLLVSAATSLSTATVLRKARRQLERETNAAGQRYNVVELPMPPLYLNWLFYTVRRAYTNSLTVNGRVLVPVFGIPEDDIALRVYEKTMPDYEIIPIQSQVGINGGGAVHCMTKEIPRATKSKR